MFKILHRDGTAQDIVESPSAVHSLLQCSYGTGCHWGPWQPRANGTQVFYVYQSQSTVDLDGTAAIAEVWQ